MDLYKVIRTLCEEKKRLNRLIESLEQIQARGDPEQAASARSRRGRKEMSPEERRQVSERMREYWAARRQRQAAEVSKAAGSESGLAAVTHSRS